MPIMQEKSLGTLDKFIISPQEINNEQILLYQQLEEIRQWFLNELLETYCYPKEWLGNRIRLSTKNDSFFGIVLTLADGTPFSVILIYQNQKLKKVETLLRKIIAENDFIGGGVASDGTQKGTIFLRKNYIDNSCNYITDFEVYKKQGVYESRSLIVGNHTHSTKQRELMPLTDNIENLFFEIHSHIRDIDGLHPGEALDELCKLLYVKLYDEESTKPQGKLHLQKWEYGTFEELATETRLLYKQANEYDLRVFRLKIPQYERSRGVFSEKIKLSSAAIYRSIETLQNYSLSDSNADIKGRAFQKVLGPTIRSGMGQYFTPDRIVSFMVEVAQPCLDDLILDPFCGSAHFLSSCLRYVRCHITPKDDKRFHEFAFGKLHGIEKSERMVRIAMTDMRLHGDGHSNIRCTDSLLEFANYPDLQQESFDLILTNPPFGSLLGRDSFSQLGKFDLTRDKQTVPLEVIGLERCIQFLRHGGRMGIVLPDGILTNKKTQYVRDWLQTKAKICAIISLPVETFTPFGANIKTSIIFLRTWKSGEVQTKDYPVSLVRIDSVGYNASGREKLSTELEEATEQLKNYFNSEGW